MTSLNLTLKEAVDICANYIQQFYNNADNIQLEEIEREPHLAEWRVTLSFENQDPGMPYIMGKIPKNYKIFRINDDGEILSMKIREFK
jgi:hypothetical protein